MGNIKIIMIIIVTLAAGFFLGGYFSQPSEKDEPSPLQEITKTEEELASEETNDVTETTEKEYTPPPKKTETTTKPALPLITKDGIYLIYYTNSGFYPLTIIIPSGTTVRFINNSDKAMKVFAKDYLFDNKYAQLNQSNTASKGETYSYVFLEKGDWNYYNNFNSEDTGTVIVY